MSILTDAQLAEYAAEIIRIDARIAELVEKRQHNLDVLLQAHKDGQIQAGKQQLGQALVTVRKGARRLDMKKIETLYPENQWPTLYTSKLDTKAVRGAFAPNQLEEFETEGEPTVQVTAAA